MRHREDNEETLRKIAAGINAKYSYTTYTDSYTGEELSEDDLRKKFDDWWDENRTVEQTVGDFAPSHLLKTLKPEDYEEMVQEHIGELVYNNQIEEQEDLGGE